MLTTQQAQSLLANGGDVVDRGGNKIGKAAQIFLDNATGEPAWVTVKTGLFGGAESFVPLENGTLTGDDVTVPHDKEKVKDAPRVEDSDGRLEPAEEEELYRYYDMTHSPSASAAHAGNHHAHDDQSQRHNVAADDADRLHSERSDGQQDVDHDISDPDSDNAMTRSEEQLHLGTQSETNAKVRLRKFIVTENVTTTVPVRHEEVRLEHEPITDANGDDALSDRESGEEDHEVELRDEHVVDEDAVPVERVRMGTETVTKEQVVNEQVRKDQVDPDETDHPDSTQQ